MSTPRWERLRKKKNNYMFSGFDNDLPFVLQPFLDFVNIGEETKFNQATVNWFENGSNTIPIHIDCKLFIKENTIVTISLGGDRVFKYQDGEDKRVTLKHGDIVRMDYSIRHGIVKSDNNDRRVSISFRKYN